MPVLRGNCARILLMTSAASLTLNGVAAAETLSSAGGDDPFASLDTLSVDELMDARGGFSAGGFKFNIGVVVTPVVVTPVTPTKPLGDGGALGGKGALPEGGALGPGGALGGKGALPEGGALGPGGALGSSGGSSNGNNAGSTAIDLSPTALPDTTTPQTQTVVETTQVPVVETSAPVVETPVPMESYSPTPVPEAPQSTPQSIVIDNSGLNLNIIHTAPVDTPAAPTSTEPLDSFGGDSVKLTSFLSYEPSDIRNSVDRLSATTKIASGEDTGVVQQRGARAEEDSSRPNSFEAPASAGETIVQQNGYSVSVDNSRDNVKVAFTTDYTVTFQNYRQGIENLTSARITQMAIGSQTILGGLSN